jgi:hypothetical protein
MRENTPEMFSPFGANNMKNRDNLENMANEPVIPTLSLCGGYWPPFPRWRKDRKKGSSALAESLSKSPRLILI